MGCSSCKQKKVINKLEPPKVEEVWVPSVDEIKLAYAELTSVLGVQPDKKEFINKVYKFLFNEEIDFNCGGCMTSTYWKFTNYIKTI